MGILDIIPDWRERISKIHEVYRQSLLCKRLGLLDIARRSSYLSPLLVSEVLRSHLRVLGHLDALVRVPEFSPHPSFLGQRKRWQSGNVWSLAHSLTLSARGIE